MERRVVKMIDLKGCLLLALLLYTDAQELDGPIITSPKEILLQKGQNYSIYCMGNTSLKFKQRDLPEEVDGPFYRVQRNVAPSNSSYKYQIALDLYNVNIYAVGYYACFDDDALNEDSVLTNLTHEPNSNSTIDYTYVYVNDSKNLIASMREIVVAKPNSEIVIECKPMYPDIQVSLSRVDKHNSTPDVLYKSPKIGYLVRTNKAIPYECEGHRGNEIGQEIKTAHIYFSKGEEIDNPVISPASSEFLQNETLVLNCTVNYSSYSLSLEWKIPRGDTSNVIQETNQNSSPSGIIYHAIRIPNAQEYDQGDYICSVISIHTAKSTKLTKTFLSSPYLNLTYGSKNKVHTRKKEFSFLYKVKAYPHIEYQFFKNNRILITNGTKYGITELPRTAHLKLVIKNLSINDIGNYTLQATNAYGTKSLTYEFFYDAGPVITFEPIKGRREKNSTAVLKCEVTGYPPPTIDWIFTDDENHKTSTQKGQIKPLSLYKLESTLHLNVSISGNITCAAKNEYNYTEATIRLLVDEISNGFGIVNSQTAWVPENHLAEYKCLASIYDFSKVTWIGPEGNLQPQMVENTRTTLSLVAILKIKDISISQAGKYTCVGTMENGLTRHQEINIEVAALRDPIIMVPQDSEQLTVKIGKPVNFSCIAESVPPPVIKWYKDGELLEDSYNIITTTTQFSTVNSTYVIDIMQDTEDVTYECGVSNGGIEERRAYYLNINVAGMNTRLLFSIAGPIFFALVALVVYLTWRVRKEKQFKKELAAAGLLYFKKGSPEALNRDLAIDGQAEHLPYNEAFEFPLEKLSLGKRLGSGAFGVVYKAEARGIVNAEETTTVAVKMVHKTADNMYIKALASELKIMVHLGKHINIVNLLGAITKNVDKRELYVIVEYCKYGNIQNYLQKHRHVFIDLLNENQKNTLGNINRGYTSSSGYGGMNTDSFNSVQTQATDQTFLNTAATRTLRSVSESGYVQPEWRSNYESDYVEDGRTPRSLNTCDLLAWSYQIACGMEYLASRKILHGDLAARNILLADDNVVKICDFGLARNIYTNDEYQKKENSPLPIKWLAIECMTDRIFSTQSDVWSFGVVLWEIFSLAKTPYPAIAPQDILALLTSGHRLEKPPYANDQLYSIMRPCWEQKPPKRPSFTNLKERLGSFLEDSVRNRFVELNEPLAKTNANRTGEDYLEQVCAPDFNNLVTPSPHQYSNENVFFGGNSPLARIQIEDDEGYLAVSPRQNTAFNFEGRNLNSRTSNTSHTSELTPMLALNNLPARGSDSDHEGNASPYLNMHPPIEEESDEVFELETKHNNLKNTQNNAVTNPSYITIPTVEKKNGLPNSYVNLIDNGLVK